MKKKMFLLCLGMVLMLTGCGGSDVKTIEGQAQATTTGKAVEAEEQSNAGTQEEVQEEAAATYKGYAYIYNGVAIEIDAEAAPIIEALGEADSYFESPSCAFEGIDKTYTYGSIEIDTYPTNDKDYISSVIFKDDSVTTTEGICIGDSLDKVKEVYGEDGEGAGGMIVYEKDGMKLNFIIQDNAVAAIEYASAVLDE